MNDRLKDYVTVKKRKQEFHAEYKDGRIVAEIVFNDDVKTVMKAFIYKNGEDQKNGIPFSTGHAQEIKGQGGPVNKTSWFENCEESAIGRALDNAGFAKDLKCSREEMEIAKNNEIALKQKPHQVDEIISLLKTLCRDWTQDEKESFVKDKLGIKNMSNIVMELTYQSLVELNDMIDFLEREINK